MARTTDGRDSHPVGRKLSRHGAWTKRRDAHRPCQRSHADLLTASITARRSHSRRSARPAPAAWAPPASPRRSPAARRLKEKAIVRTAAAARSRLDKTDGNLHRTHQGNATVVGRAADRLELGRSPGAVGVPGCTKRISVVLHDSGAAFGNATHPTRNRKAAHVAQKRSTVADRRLYRPLISSLTRRVSGRLTCLC
jgi:hypothetical protein